MPVFVNLIVLCKQLKMDGVGLGCNSVVEHMLSMCKAPSSIPSTEQWPKQVVKGLKHCCRILTSLFGHTEHQMSSEGLQQLRSGPGCFTQGR